LFSPGCALFDFESPLQGWHISGEAFNNQPIYGGNNSAPGHYGNWLIDSSSNVTSPCQKNGASIGGSAKGAMTSPTFRIRDSNLTFLIGGKKELIMNIALKFLLYLDFKIYVEISFVC
jgi:hypothetical protein